MDASHLGQQLNASIGQLHGLFDEIGVPGHEREAREAELFAALAEALESQVRLVTTEKKDMVDEAKKIITTIRQMETSLDNSRRSRDYQDDDLQITYPLNRCLQLLKEKHNQIKRLHKERYEQVKKLVDALESYSSHLEPTFVQIPLPPTDPNQSIPPTFDLSPNYVDKLDAEFTRVYEQYEGRVRTVQQLSEGIISLWAELGIPQAQQDSAVLQFYRDAPEQLGLHEEDISRLRSKHDRLAAEKQNREKRLQDLKNAVESLWEKLEIDPAETKAFVNSNRGCGLRQINEFEGELSRLNELKRQNMHLFVEDARVKLQDLWDALYFSEDEMLEFTPAFSDVYSDALLEAHEREVARLETLREQREPMLEQIRKYKSLIQERDDLAASSQDASRLMARGQKGERRDPGKLLREEKMRKRIAKELPKVKVEVRKSLEKWEDEYGRPFLVHGERFLDELEAEEPRKAGAGGARSKTPAGRPPSAGAVPKSVPNRANGARSAPPSRAGAKTPTAGGPGVRKSPGKTPGKAAGAATVKGTVTNGRTSPSRIPARMPLSNLKHGNNPSDRPRADSAGDGQRTLRAPPPKMRDLKRVPELETPVNPYKGVGLAGGIVRPVEPEDVYDDRPVASRVMRPNSTQSYHNQPSPYEEPYDSGYDVYDDHSSEDRYATVRPSSRQVYPMAPPPPRQISGTSHSSAGVSGISGSENWETYDDNSEPEPDASDAYMAKLRAARRVMETDHSSRPLSSCQGRGIRGIPPSPSGPTGYAQQRPAMFDQDGHRIMSGSEWTDEDGF